MQFMDLLGVRVASQEWFTLSIVAHDNLQMITSSFVGSL